MRRALAVLAASLAALALIACGSDDGSTPSAPGTDDNGEERAPRGNAGFDPQEVYEDAAPGVVTITSVFGGNQDLGGLFEEGDGGPAAGQGTGFVISEDGEIVTNAHVVTNARTSGPNEDLEAARNVFVQFADRNSVPADVVGFDPFADVALLKVEPDGLELEPLELGSSAEVEVGEQVAAIGSPFGQAQSLSTGIVSATNRSIESLTAFQIDGAIQTDASINPGNSGGPLLDANGRVIGINQQINTRSGGNEGVGFAVPADLVERSIESLREDGDPDYPYIGVSVQPLYPQLAEELEFDTETGALIVEVVPGAPADEAGLKGGRREIRFQGRQIQVGGDVITAVEGEEIVEESDLPRLIAQHQAGDEITLEVIRADGDTEEVTVELEERPDTPLPEEG